MPPALVETVPAQLKALFSVMISFGLSEDWLPTAAAFTEELLGIRVILEESTANLKLATFIA